MWLVSPRTPRTRENTFCLRIPWMKHGYGSIPRDTIFSGMNIHLPAILVFTMGIGFWPISIFLVFFMLWEECNMRTKIHHFGKTPLGGWLCRAMVSQFFQHRWCKWVERVCFYHIPKHISNHISNHDNSHLGYAWSKFQSNSCAFPVLIFPKS